MRSKLNRMMAHKQPTRGIQTPLKQARSLKVLPNKIVLQRAPGESTDEWLVVMVEPRCEAKAINSLREAGHMAWHPQMTVWITNHRLRTKTETHKPVFPRYIFVSKSQTATKSVLACDHITYLVSSVPRRSAFMDDLSDRQQAGWANSRKPTSPFEGHQEVMICDEGPFHGLTGIIDRTDAERTTILLEILGTMRRFETDTDRLKKVA